jgi:hypothetical protein
VDVGEVVGDSRTAKEAGVFDEGLEGVDFVAEGAEKLSKTKSPSRLPVRHWKRSKER